MNRNSVIILLLLAGLTLSWSSCKREEVLPELVSNPGSSLLDVENEGYKVRLAAVQPPEGQQGTWRIYSGENGRFEDASAPNSLFFGEPGETYLLGWEVSLGQQTETEMINVSFKALEPQVHTFVQDSVYHNISLQLEAEAAKFGATGSWSIVEGEDGQLIDADSPETIFIGKENSSYTLSWKLSYGSKADSVLLSFATDELSSLPGEDNLDILNEKEAEIKYYNLDAILPAGGTGSWELISGKGGTIYGLNDPHALFEGLADTSYVLTWTVEVNGYEATDTLNLRFRGLWGTWIDERDGQAYRFATINGMEWMAENFNYLPRSSPSGYGMSWYYGQSSRANIEDGHAVESPEDRKHYGRLYNYYAAFESTPEGWRLPTMKELQDLESHLGGAFFAHDRMIEGGDSGLDLIRGGLVGFGGDSPNGRDNFSQMDETGYYWTGNYYEDFSAIGLAVFSDGFAMGRFSAYWSGYSVRYVREIQ